MSNNNKLTQEEVWDSIGQDWKQYRQEPFKEVKDFLKDKHGKILDIACGSGRSFKAMNKDCEIYALDFSKRMLEFAKKNANELRLNVKLFKADASKLPFESEFFDYAIFIAGLHCIDSEDKRKRALKELYRVMKNNAEALLTVWSKNHETLIKRGVPGKKDQIITWKKDGTDYPRYYYIYDKEELEDLLVKTGFSIVSSKEEDNIIVEVEK